MQATGYSINEVNNIRQTVKWEDKTQTYFREGKGEKKRERGGSREKASYTRISQGYESGGKLARERR